MDASIIVKGVVDKFLAMCEIPHGSWNEQKLASALESRLNACGWVTARDTAGNLRADLPAAPGCENAPLVALQGHLDMVCAVAEGSGWDPQRDPVCAHVENGVLRTDGRSSLGADNNLGNAAVLYLMEQSFAHGPIRLLFTVAEEVGLEGASAMDPSWLSGVRYLINTDGFQLGRVIVSSASGRRERYYKELQTVPVTKSAAWKIGIGGGIGGHSGDDINKGRANSIKLLAMLLGELREEVDYELAEFSGGHALNAIPMGAGAVLVADGEAAKRIEASVKRFNEGLRTVYGRTDPRICLSAVPTERPQYAWKPELRDSLLELLNLLHDGVFAMHDSIPGLVSASSNVGQVRSADGRIEVCCFTRSDRAFSEEMLVSRHEALVRLTGFCQAVNRYPGWAGDRDNPLACRMAEIYKRLTGEDMEITGVHVGLEPAVLGAKNPNMIMVCTGPDILDPHSTHERAPLAGLPAYVRLLKETLEQVGSETVAKST